MEYDYLGKSGIQISKLLLGCMSYGSKKWENWCIDDEEEALKLMKYAYDRGIRTFDTADMYSNGESERMVGKFLKRFNIPRSTIVIITKVFAKSNWEGIEDDSPKAWINRYGLSRKHIMNAVQGSMERLGTYIDLYLIHRYDKTVPPEEVMKTLHDLVTSDKVRYIGASSMMAYQFAEYQHVADKHGWTQFICMQNFYHLAYREEEREMIPYCKKNNIGITPWSPIGRGILARPNSAEPTHRLKTDHGLEKGFSTFKDADSTKVIVDRVEEISKKKGVSMAQVAIAWTLHKGTNPIVGLSSIERIDEAIAALKVSLSDEEIAYLEEPYVPQWPQGIRVYPEKQ